MIINVYGTTDKRIILYSLLKLFRTQGDTLVVSNNRQVSRLLGDGETYGHFLDTLVVVTDSSPDEVHEEIGYLVGDFYHVIYDVNTYFSSEADMSIICLGYSVSEEEKSMHELLPNPVFLEFGFGQALAKDKKERYPRFEYDKTISNYIEIVESTKALYPLKSSSLAKALQYIFKEKDAKLASNIQKLLMAKWEF